MKSQTFQKADFEESQRLTSAILAPVIRWLIAESLPAADFR